MKFCKPAEAPQTTSVCARWLFDEWGHRTPGFTLEGAVQKFSSTSSPSPLWPSTVIKLQEPPVWSPRKMSRAALLARGWRAYLSLRPCVGKGSPALVEDEARRQGYGRIWLSAAVPDMYLKMGYEYTGISKNDEPIMVKDLAR